MKEQKCLLGISSLSDKDLSIKELLKKAVNILPEGWKYPNITEAEILFDGKSYKTKKFQKTQWWLSAVNKKLENGRLQITVVYLEKKPVLDIGPFTEREKHLIDSILDILTQKIENILDKQELKRKQQILENAYQLAKIGDWEINFEQVSMYWSDQVRKIHEVDRSFKPDFHTTTQFYLGKDKERIKETFNAAVKEGKSFDVEVRIITAKGNEKWVRNIGQPVFKNGKCVRLFGCLQDIDDQKQVEKAIKKSEQRLRSLVQGGMDLIAIFDEDYNYKYVVPTKHREERMGRYPDEYIGKNVFEIFHPYDSARLKEVFENLEPNGSTEVAPFRYKKSDGEWGWMESTITNLLHIPEINGYVTNSRDVTERISQQQKLADVIHYSTNLFYRHDVNHVLTYVSPQSEHFLGCSPEEAKKHWTKFVTDHPVNKLGFERTSKTIKTGEIQDPFELQIQKVNGEKIWVEVNEAPVLEDGNIVAIVGSLTDITKRKQAYEKLEELSLVASKTTDLILITDNQGSLKWVNNAFEKFTGYGLEEIKGNKPWKFLHGPETDPETLRHLNGKLRMHETTQVTIRNYTREGREYWVDMTVDPVFDNDEKCIGFISIQKDVTDKIKQRKRLQESLERYDIVTKATSDTIWDADLENDKVSYNYNIRDIFGYEMDEIEASGDWWLSKIHPDDRERVSREFEVAELTNMNRIQTEYRFRCADGSYKYINDRAFIINDEQAKPVRMIGAMQDITKQVEENQWLKLLESAIDNTTESIAILEESSDEFHGRKILYVNDAFEKMTGFKRDEALEKSLLNFIGRNTDRRKIAKVLKSLDQGKACETEIAFFDNKGEECWAQISFAPVRDSYNQFTNWICIGRDTTERRERERQLKDSLSEKQTLLMEIHHRVKNNLAVVSSLMHLQAIEDPDEVLQKKLFDSISRIRTMVTIHELLYESGSFAKIDFSKNLEKLVSMIIDTGQNGVKLQWEYIFDEIELNVNQAIPSSLIVNEVVTNAIKHAFKEREAGRIELVVKEKDNQIAIEIKDNGIGLPEDLKNRENSLGMRLIKVLAEQISADYDFKSDSGKGTVFSLQFEKKFTGGIGNAYLN